MPIGVNSSGQIGVKPSSLRYKEAVQPMDKASETVLALKPVTFRYKKEIDPDRTPEFGLVAEEVEKVNPDLVARDAGGKVYTVRYDAVNAMLLNEFLKAHRKLEEQQATTTQVESKAERQEATITHLESALAHFESTGGKQQKEIQAITATLKAQAALIQKVIDQRRTRAPAQRVVAND